MKEYSYTEARQNLKKVLNEATESHEKVRITNRRGRNAILVDEEDYNSLLETAYLLRSPRNAERLLKAKKRSLEEALSYEDVIEALGLEDHPI